MCPDDAYLLTDAAEAFRKDFFCGLRNRSEEYIRQKVAEQLVLVREWASAPLPENDFVKNFEVPAAAMLPAGTEELSKTVEDLLLFVPAHVKAAYEAGSLGGLAHAKRRRTA